MSKKTLQNRLETLVVFKYLLLNVVSNLLRKKNIFKAFYSRTQI